jgi:hypothetical protein
MAANSSPGWACFIVYRSEALGPDFRVKVQDAGRQPARGLRLQLDSRASGSKVFASTDENGAAFFRDINAGAYYLSAHYDAGIGDAVLVEVKLRGPRGLTVALTWPVLRPIVVSSLRGSIRAPGYFPGRAQPRFSLDLLEAPSGRKLKSSQATERGEFSFEDVDPGLYFVRLTPPGTFQGSITVAVKPDAPADHLEVDLAWTSCGLQYTDASQCPQSDLSQRRLSGQVTDANGGAIQDAVISVLDRGEILVERLRSDGAGKFVSPSRLAGTYQLVVTGAGFTPLRAAVRLRPDDSEKLSALTIRMGLSGECSAAEIR